MASCPPSRTMRAVGKYPKQSLLNPATHSGSAPSVCRSSDTYSATGSAGKPTRVRPGPNCQTASGCTIAGRKLLALVQHSKHLPRHDGFGCRQAGARRDFLTAQLLQWQLDVPQRCHQVTRHGGQLPASTRSTSWASACTMLARQFHRAAW